MNLFSRFLIASRKIKYRCLSTVKIVGSPCVWTPVLSIGLGNISVSDSATLGYRASLYFYSGYIHLESRSVHACITIGNNVFINNGCVLIAEDTSITIGDDCLVGPNTSFYDSDFHELDPLKRVSGIPVQKPVVICKNVFIGANVIILKGVTIGENSVVAAGSVVTKSFGPNLVVGGNSAKVIRSL